MARRKNGRSEHEDGSITIDLNEAPKTDEKPASTDYGVKAEVPVETTRREPLPSVLSVPPSSQGMAEGNDLESQIKAMKSRQEAAEQRARQAETARAQEAQRAQQAIAQSRGEVDQSNYDAIANALLARQNEVAILKQQKADARVRGDAATEVEIEDRLDDAKADLRTLRDGKQDLERQFQQRQRAPQQQQPPPQPPQHIDEVIARMPGLMPTEQEWLRRHPDAVFDQLQLQQLQAAFSATQKRNLLRGSPEYFRFIDDRLGYESDEPEYDEVDDMPNEPTRVDRPVVAAPPSRSAPGVSSREARSNSQVTLSPVEREHAKISGITEREYAQNKQRLVEMKRRGYYSERG
jgi:hypothetical protein